MKKTTSWDYTPENYSKEKASALNTNRNRLTTKFLMLLLLFLGVSVSGLGQALYESFNYSSPGNIGGNTSSSGTTNNNWTTHSNNQTGIISVENGSLIYNDLQSATNNKIKIPGSNSTVPRDINRNACIEANQSTIYYSFLLNVIDNTQLASTFGTSGNGYFVHLSSTSGSSAANFTAKIHIRSSNTGANYRLGISETGNTPTEVTGDLTFGNSYLIVVKYIYNNTAGKDLATMWVNPSSLGDTEPTGGISGPGSNNVSSYISTNIGICIRNASATPKAEIDEIRVGTTWASVTPTESLNITYNSNTATSGTVPTDNTSYSSGAEVTILGNTGSLEKTGYTFINWNTAANGSGTSYSAGNNFTINANTTLYAQWTPNNNTITFDGNGATAGSMSAQTIATDASANLTSNGFSKTGYSFAGWATTAGGTVTYTNGASYTMGTSNVTLYAKWTPNNNTITFDGNGATGGSMPTQTIATDASANLNSNAFTRTGYVFKEWNSNSDGTGTAYANGANYTMGTSDVTLFAIWDEVTTPTINVSGTLSGLSTTYGTASASASFTVSGAALTHNITITPPAGFEVSTTSGGESGFATTQTLIPSSGNVAITTVYVRLTAISVANNYSGNIVVTSDALNETIAIPTSTVNPYALTISGLSGENKVYNGTTAASLNGTPTLSATVNSDLITLTGTAIAAFIDANVANNKTINISGFSLSGTNSSSYALTAPTTTANITTAALTITGISISDKVYNGNTAATIAGTAEYVGLVNAETFSVTGTPIAVFEDTNVNTNISVTVSGYTAPSANYSITQPTGLTANIIKANQTISGLAATDSKTTTTSTYTISGVSATSGLTVSFSSSNESVATISGTTVTIVGAGTTTITATQAGNGNYNAAPDVTQSLTVTLAPVVIAGWDFSTLVGGTGVWGASPYLATTSNSNVTIGGLTRGAGFGTLSGSAAGNAWGANNFTFSNSTFESEIAANKYFTFTIKANSGYKISLSNIGNYNIRRSSTGPTTGQWQYQIDNGSFVNIGSAITWGSGTTSSGNSQTSIDLSVISQLQNILSESTITIRLVNYGAITNASGTLYLNDPSDNTENDFVVYGYIVPIYSITASSNDELKGSVSGGGAKDTGASVSLTATPESGYRFVNWTENGSFVSKANPLEFTASVARNLVANFDDYSPAISGEVNASTLADCPTCDVTVSEGASLTINENKAFNSVTVAPGGKLTLNNGHSFSPGTFTLESDATGTATFVDERTHANKTNITATVQQHLPAATDRTWWYLASPVTGAASSVFGSNKVGDYSEADRSYSSPFATPTTLTAGKGYVVKMTAESAANYIFENKTLNTGDISVALTRTVTQTPDNAKRGFNLVGNPYPSYLNWDLAYNNSTNVRSTIWYRTLNGASMEFHTYNATLNASVPSSASGYIPPMQAFWVKVDKDPTEGSVSNGTLNFTNDMRSHDLSALGNPLKTPAADRNLVRLSISNGTLSDETVIATHPSASDSYDRFDSEKMANGDTNRPEIFSMAGNQELVINGISPLTDSKQIALGVRPGVAGNYTISLTEWRNTGNMEAVLRDNQLGEELILTESSSYSFDTDGSTSTSRFSLLFRAKGSNTGFDRISSDLLIYASQKSIRVESASLEGNAISIFNALGQPVFNGKAQNNRLEINGLTPAVYMVKVNNQTKMVIVK